MIPLYVLRAILLIGALGSQAAVWAGARYLWGRLNQKGWHGCLDVPDTNLGYCVATRKADGPIKGERCAVFGEASFCVGLGSARRPDWRMCVADNRTHAEAVIVGCTRIIEAGLDTAINIGTAYYNRANARWAVEVRTNRAQPALTAAVADFDEAIKRRPTWGEAFLAETAYRLKPTSDRLGLICDAKSALDRVREALTDCDRALAQSPDPGSY